MILSKILKQNGFKAYVVGGAIRDIVINRRVVDFDVATDAPPNKVKKLFKRVIATGIKHGTVTVWLKGVKIEVTTFRVDDEYIDGRRPKSVKFIPSIYEDLKRRDFTINAIAYDPIEKEIIDPHSGLNDIKQKTIRAIGNPLERFREDGLRLIRACRFASQLGFLIEPKTFEAIKKSAYMIEKISRERIRDELIKVLLSPKPSVGFICMEKTTLLSRIMPELQRCVNVKQRGMHCFDVFFHSLYSCDAAPSHSYKLRLAALLHDIGKPEAYFINEGDEIRFHNHEVIGAELAESILKRLRFSNEEIKYVTHLIRHHMFNYTEDWGDAAVRRFVFRVGTDFIEDILALRRADQIGTCNKYFISQNLIAFEKRINRVISQSKVFSYKDLKINGDDIIKHLNIKPGKTVGTILQFLLESVLDDPKLNDRETLLMIARNFYNERLKRD